MKQETPETQTIINDIDDPKGESVNDVHIDPDSKEIENPESPITPPSEDLTDQENIDPKLEIL